MQRQEETRSKEYDSIKAEIISKLRQLGLSSYGARAFLAVLESQPVSATTICKSTSIPDSKIYYALKELEDKKLIMVQHGTPSTYRISSSKQILSGLESDIESEYRSKIESARKLEKSLEPLVAQSSEANSSDVELAYIIKGFKNIVGKMKEVALQARKEIVFMAANAKLVNDLEEKLEEIKSQRQIPVRIAIAQKLLDSRQFKTQLRPNRSLLCECNVMIVDSEKLVSAELGDPEHEYGIVTQNQSMITLMRKSYDNPSCCST